MHLPISVVITTYNRCNFVGRAIQSVVNQNWPDLELLVVDDASSDGTAKLIQNSFPQLRYLQQKSNEGVGAARNRGLHEASRPWVAFLDDDDTLSAGALARIGGRIAEFAERGQYPVLQFATSHGRIARPFIIATMKDYMTERLCGDFTPVIQREYFLAEGLAYPNVRAGECILWFRVADRYGIPTWADKVVEVHVEAPLRLTCLDYHLQHAREFAELQERILSEFQEVVARRFPAYYQTKLLGAATYRMLAGEPAIARRHLRSALRCSLTLKALGLLVLSFLPQRCARKCYALYKRANRRTRIE